MEYILIHVAFYFSVELLLNCVQCGKKFGTQVLHALEAAILESVTRDRLTP